MQSIQDPQCCCCRHLVLSIDAVDGSVFSGVLLSCRAQQAAAITSVLLHMLCMLLTVSLQFACCVWAVVERQLVKRMQQDTWFLAAVAMLLAMQWCPSGGCHRQRVVQMSDQIFLLCSMDGSSLYIQRLPLLGRGLLSCDEAASVTWLVLAPAS